MRGKRKRESAVALGNELFEVGSAAKRSIDGSEAESREKFFKRVPSNRVAWRVIGAYVKRNFVRRSDAG